MTGNQYLEQLAAMDRYRAALEYLRDLALSPHDSVQCTADIRRLYESGR